MADSQGVQENPQPKDRVLKRLHGRPIGLTGSNFRVTINDRSAIEMIFFPYTIKPDLLQRNPLPGYYFVRFRSSLCEVRDNQETNAAVFEDPLADRLPLSVSVISFLPPMMGVRIWIWNFLISTWGKKNHPVG